MKITYERLETCKDIIINLCKNIFKSDKILWQSDESNNKQSDLVITKWQKDLKVEVKVRLKDYGDFLVEATQYESEFKHVSNLDWLIEKSTGWLFKTKADIILYITPEKVLIVFWKKTKVIILKNFYNYIDRICKRSWKQPDGKIWNFIALNKSVPLSDIVSYTVKPDLTEFFSIYNQGAKTNPNLKEVR